MTLLVRGCVAELLRKTLPAGSSIDVTAVWVAQRRAPAIAARPAP